MGRTWYNCVIGEQPGHTAPFGMAIQPDSSMLGHFRNKVLNFGTNFLFQDVAVAVDDVRRNVGLPPRRKSFSTRLFRLSFISKALYLSLNTLEVTYHVTFILLGRSYIHLLHSSNRDGGMNSCRIVRLFLLRKEL